jgi:hypothetical protein
VPAPFDVLRFRRGSTTLDIAAGTTYALDRGGWSPKVATLRESTIGNQALYNEVVEDMTLNIYGATVDAANLALSNLVSFLDQSERWARGEEVGIVTLEYLPKGSEAIGIYKAEVRGHSTTNDSINLQPTYNQDLLLFTISGIRIRFVRSGEWYINRRWILTAGQIVDDDVSIGAFDDFQDTLVTTTPNFFTNSVAGSFIAGSDYQDVSIRIQGINSGTNAKRFFDRSFLAQNNGSSEMFLRESVWISSSPAVFTSTASSSAYGGFVQKYVPTTGQRVLVFVDGGGVFYPAKRVALFMLARGEKGAAWRVQAGTNILNTATQGLAHADFAPEKRIVFDLAAGDVEPELFFLGTVEMEQDWFSDLLLYLTPESWNSIDEILINYLVAVVLDDESNVIQMFRTLDDPVTTGFPNGTMRISNGVLEFPHPKAGLNFDTFPNTTNQLQVAVNTAGNLRMITKDVKLNFALLIKKWQKWVYYDHADEAAPIDPQTFGITLYRTLCYRIPR